MHHTQSEDLGNGFYCHGIATPAAYPRGTVATLDGSGRNVVLVWLFDHRGGYALLVIDVATGKTRQIETPFPPGGDCPYASILSTRGRYYTQFNGYFCEFDPTRAAFSFCGQTTPRMAMSMTEDASGRIWSVSYPDSGVLCFDPTTSGLRDYGSLYSQNWFQYPRSIAVDDSGWIYWAIGSAASQILAMDPDSGQTTPVLPEARRAKGYAEVYRDKNGTVYGRSDDSAEGGWYELSGGNWKQIGEHEERSAMPISAGLSGFVHPHFPDGSRLESCDLIDRVLVVLDPGTGHRSKVSFDYTTDGGEVMGLAASPDGTICGGTTFPKRFFRYDPASDAWTNRPCHGQWNTVARQGDRFFVGGYGRGNFLEWDPSRPWEDTDLGGGDANPKFHLQCTPAIFRPHVLLAHPDGHTLVMGGIPAYGHTGGGLLFWDRRTDSHVLLEHTEVLPEQATMSLAPLPERKLLGGSTVNPGTGGERTADVANLYIMDIDRKELDWHAALLPGVQSYTTLCPGPDGTAFGFADCETLFVFDAASRSIVHQRRTVDRFGRTAHQQGPRVFVTGPNQELYVLFERGIASLDQESYAIELVAESPVHIRQGGDILDGRIYFADGSHVYSYRVPE